MIIVNLCVCVCVCECVHACVYHELVAIYICVCVCHEILQDATETIIIISYT